MPTIFTKQTAALCSHTQDCFALRFGPWLHEKSRKIQAMCPPTFRKLGSSLRRGELVCNMCNELFQWLEVQENICKFDLYVLCDACLIIYLYIYISVCVRARVRTVTDERNKPIKSTTESLSGVPCLGSPLRFAVQALSSCFWLRRTLPPTTPNHPGIAVRAFIIFYLVF